MTAIGDLRSKLRFLISMALTIGACSSSGVDSDLQIRIKNDTGKRFSNFWLGAGTNGGATQNTTYGAIDAGETTTYKGVERVLQNYHKGNGVIDDVRYFHRPQANPALISDAFGPGRYTIIYALPRSGTDLIVDATRDGD